MEPSIALALFPVFYLVCGVTVAAFACGVALLLVDRREARRLSATRTAAPAAELPLAA